MRQYFEYHPVIGYRYVPHLRARIPHEGGGYLIQANEAGFRSNRPFLRERSAGRPRVLLFGDSFTAGDSVPNHLRYSDLLETRVPGLEVYNFGLPSTGTDQQYLVWREFAQGIEHDLTVIAVYVENIRRNAAAYRVLQDEHGRERIYAKPYFTLEGGGLRLNHVPPRPEPFEEHELPPSERHKVDTCGRFLALRKAVNALGAKELVQRLTRYQPVPEYDSPHTPAWRLTRAILAQWVRAAGTPVVLMPIPLFQHVEGLSDARPYQARFRELAAELGCALHDPLPDLLGHSPEERRRFRWERDVHLTPRGNEVVAESVAPLLGRMLAGQP